MIHFDYGSNGLEAPLRKGDFQPVMLIYCRILLFSPHGASGYWYTQNGTWTWNSVKLTPEAHEAKHSKKDYGGSLLMKISIRL